MTGSKMKKKTKKTNFNAGLDKVGFIEAQGFNPGNRISSAKSPHKEHGRITGDGDSWNEA